MSIRIRLLLLSLAILLLPLAGYQYVREMERFLRQELGASVQFAATDLAALLHDRQDLLPAAFTTLVDGHSSIYLHSLDQPIQIDGYSSDWEAWLDWAKHYGPVGNGFTLLAGMRGRSVYVRIRVDDGERVPAGPEHPARKGDAILMVFTDPAGRWHRFHIATVAPGGFSPYRLAYDALGELQARPIPNIRAAWQEQQGGYTVELAIPARLLGARLGFIVTDVDPGTPEQTRRVGTAGEATLKQPGRLLRPLPGLRKLFVGLQLGPGRRLWIVGRQGQVLASVGSLKRDLPRHALNLLYTLILPPVDEQFSDDLAGAARLDGAEIRAALEGRAERRWRSAPGGRAVIVSAASPVRIGGQVVGAVVVEETANRIQTVQRQALATVFNRTLLAFIGVTVLLLIFASRLSLRLSRLSREAAAAIDEHGRVLQTRIGDGGHDEIGSLGERFSVLLLRLKQYTSYLEGMRSRLAHELRTPLSVVRSSLDNLESAGGDIGAAPGLARARTGIDRLSALLNRLSEATRLEQAVQTVEMEVVDLVGLIRGCVQGYRLANPSRQIEFVAPPGPLRLRLAPDLIVQMLDKLLANALDFGLPERPIRVELMEQDRDILLKVLNFGPRLPLAGTDTLFGAMVSLRDKGGRQPHLGLGLHIVRLIAECHGGGVEAEDLADGSGVCFRVRLARV